MVPHTVHLQRLQIFKGNYIKIECKGPKVTHSGPIERVSQAPHSLMRLEMGKGNKMVHLGLYTLRKG